MDLGLAVGLKETKSFNLTDFPAYGLPNTDYNMVPDPAEKMEQVVVENTYDYTVLLPSWYTTKLGTVGSGLGISFGQLTSNPMFSLKTTFRIGRTLGYDQNVTIKTQYDNFVTFSE